MFVFSEIFGMSDYKNIQVTDAALLFGGLVFFLL